MGPIIMDPEKLSQKDQLSDFYLSDIFLSTSTIFNIATNNMVLSEMGLAF